jgi:hypothetical protein
MSQKNRSLETRHALPRLLMKGGTFTVMHVVGTSSELLSCSKKRKFNGTRCYFPLVSKVYLQAQSVQGWQVLLLLVFGDYSVVDTLLVSATE